MLYGSVIFNMLRCYPWWCMACAHQTVKRIGQMIRCFGNRIAMCGCLVCVCLLCEVARDIHVCLFGSLNHVYDCVFAGGL